MTTVRILHRQVTRAAPFGIRRAEHPARPAQIFRIGTRSRRADTLAYRPLSLITPQLRQPDLRDRRIILTRPHPYRLASVKVAAGPQPLACRLPVPRLQCPAAATRRLRTPAGTNPRPAPDRLPIQS